MKKFHVLFLSVQPLVLAALMSFFCNDSILVADFDDYSNFFNNKINYDTYNVLVFDDGSLEENELKKINKCGIKNNKIKKILYTDKMNLDYSNYYIRYDIDSIVSKRADVKVLRETILNALSNNKYSCGNSSYIMGFKEVNSIETLSKREKEILLLLAEGLKNRDIARELFTSYRTIETHKTHMVKKLELKNTTELLCFAVKNLEHLKL